MYICQYVLLGHIISNNDPEKKEMMSCRLLQLTSLECDGFTGHQDNVRSLVVALHLEMTLRLAFFPLGA